METLMDPVTRAQVVSIYVDSIKTVWYVSMDFAALAFVLVIVEKEIPLRKELDTKFSMEEKAKSAKIDPEDPPRKSVQVLDSFFNSSRNSSHFSEIKIGFD